MEEPEETEVWRYLAEGPTVEVAHGPGVPPPAAQVGVGTKLVLVGGTGVEVPGVAQPAPRPVMVRVYPAHAPPAPAVTEFTTITTDCPAGTVTEKSVGTSGLAPMSPRKLVPRLFGSNVFRYADACKNGAPTHVSGFRLIVTHVDEPVVLAKVAAS